MRTSKSHNLSCKISGLRWEATRRMEFIEFRLYWEGKVNRGDLTDFFAISIPQASNDLSRYQELAPNNIDYDKSGKFYFATTEFIPIFYEPSSEHYLSLLKQVSSGISAKEDVFIKSFPEYDLIPILERPITAEMLKAIVDSIKNGIELRILYQSMSRPNPLSRWIAPKSLAYDGFRWGIRAYCFTNSKFMDFNIGRIWRIEETRPSTLVEYDTNWYKEIVLRIGPNPGLTEDQQKTIEMEYGMVNGVKEVIVKQPFLSYFLKHYGLDPKNSERPPEAQHIVLLNPEELPKDHKSIGQNR